jgi:hypothetical protein
MRDYPDDDIWIDSNSALTERVRFGEQEVIVHYDDVPDKDRTTVDGIPCTTALRTVIDLAPDLEHAELRRMVRNALDRRLFTVEDAMLRTFEHDMLERPGAVLLRYVLSEPGVR